MDDGFDENFDAEQGNFFMRVQQCVKLEVGGSNLEWVAGFFFMILLYFKVTAGK